jgi:Putative MetA-pathway of phenol degradation
VNRRSLVLGAAAAALSSPALADHMGPSGVGGGAGLNVIGPETLDEGHGALGIRIIYTRPEQRSDEELEALAAQHVHAHNTDYNLNASLGAAYGITHELTISAEMPYVRRDNLREGEHSHVGGETINEVAQLGDVAGLGDLSLLAKYRLTHGEGSGFALIAGLKVPTGSTHKHDLEGERLETEHQPGTGSWDPILGAAGGTKLGPMQISASALYQFSGKGAQRTRLGDRAQAGIALSHRFGPPEHHHDDADEHDHDHGEHEHAAPHGHQSFDAFIELSGEWEGRQKVDGDIEQASGGKTLWLTPGARFNSASGFSVAAAFGIPVWQHIRASHPDNDYRLTFSIGRGL